MPHKYATTQVNLDPSAVEKFRELVSAIPDDHLAGDGRSDDPHVTVQYGIIPDSPDDLVDAISAVGGPGRITFGPSKVFPPTEHSDDAAVVYLPVIEGAEYLRKIRAAVRGSVQTKDNFPKYIPHMTLAYVKPGVADWYADGGIDPGNLSMEVTEVMFSSRAGKRRSIPVNEQTGKTAMIEKKLPVTGYDAAADISKRLRVNRKSPSDPKWMTPGQNMVPGNSLWKRRGEKSAEVLGPPEPVSDVGPFEDETPARLLTVEDRSPLHAIAGGLNTLTGGRPVARGWPGGPLYGAAVKGLLGAGIGAGIATLQSPRNKRRRRLMTALGGLGGLALGVPGIAARVYNNRAGVPEAQGRFYGLFRSNDPPYFNKKSGLIDSERGERYSAALATYMLERDRNLLHMPYTQAILSGAVQDASDAGLIGSFTAGDLAKSLVRSGVYAGAAVPVAKVLGMAFGLSAPVQDRLVQVGMLGSLVKGVGSVLGEE